MKRNIIQLFTLLMLFSIIANATSYTWNGATSTAWNTTTNWTPNGTPGTGDVVTITSSGTYHPVLANNVTVNRVVISGGTLGLNGDTLTASSSTSTFSGGTISNGHLILRGSTMTFAGATLSVTIDAVVSEIIFNGGTFNNYCHFETNTVVPGSGTGGCTFNDSTYFYHNYASGGVWRFNTNTGNTFHGKVKLKNISSSEMTFAGAGINVFNGDIVIENSANGGIFFGNDTLKSGKTLTIGSGGYSDGEFRATNFYQEGTTAQSLTFTGTALPTIDGATFNGPTSISSGLLLFKNCKFNNTAALTATGTSSSSWYGGNKFYGDVTITNNASAGNLRVDADTANTYYANATFNGSRDLRVTYGGDVSSFYGNITTNSNVKFDQGSGTLCLAGSGTQSLNFNSSTLVKNLKLNKSGGSAALASALTVTTAITFVKGILITTSSYLLTLNHGGTVSGASDSSFIAGPIKKIGNAAFIFPVGKANFYRAVEIAAPSTSTDAFTAEYFVVGQSLGNTMDTTINYISDCNYWNLTRTTGSSNVIVKFQYDSLDCDWIEGDSVHIANWNGTKWIDKGVGVNDNGFKKINTAFTSFGNFLFSYKLASPHLGVLRNFACVTNDSLVLNDTLKINIYGASRRCNNTSLILTSSNHFSDSLLLDSLKTKIQIAQNLMKNLTGISKTSSSINAHVLTHGVYTVSASLNINDYVTLQGDSSSIFIFNVSGNLNISNGAAINLDGVRPNNIYFNVDSAINITGTNLVNGILFSKQNMNISGNCNGSKAFFSIGKIIINDAVFVSSPIQLSSPYLGLIFKYGACNLQYSQSTVKIHQRNSPTIPYGTTTPSFTIPNITGPVIMANILFTVVSTTMPANSYPLVFGTTPITANRVGLAVNNSTCWLDAPLNFHHTASYRASIPFNILNIGSSNAVTGFPVSTTHIDGTDTDGACLFVVYQNECGSGTGNEFGFLDVSYGLAINNNNNTLNETLTAFTPYTGGSLISSSAFMIVGDYETDVNDANFLAIDGTAIPIIADMYNFVELQGFDVTNGIGPVFHSDQSTGTDCGNLSLIGAHYIYENPTSCGDFTLTSTVTPISTCTGNTTGSINLTVAPSGTYTYLWSNAATTQNISGLSAGSYTVSVTSTGTLGCYHSLTIPVTVENTLSATITKTGDIALCGTDPYYAILKANPNVIPATYLWSTSATTQSISVSVAGTYTVTVIAGTCTTSVNYTVHAPAKPDKPSIVGLISNCSEGATLPYTNVAYNALYDNDPLTASTYYEWLFNGVPVTSYPSSSSISPTLTPYAAGQVICILYYQGCVLSDTLYIFECCGEERNDIDEHLIYDGSDVDFLVGQGLANHNGLTGIYEVSTSDILYFNGVFNVNKPLAFIDCPRLYFAEGASILCNNVRMFIDNSHFQAACEKMWEGIIVKGIGQIVVESTTPGDSTIIEDAQYGIHSFPPYKVFVHGSTVFNRNYTGILIDNLTNQMPNNPIRIYGTRFGCDQNLIAPFGGQFPTPGTNTFAGIDIQRSIKTDIGIASQPFNKFMDINIGIRSRRSNLNVIRSTFHNIQPSYSTAFGGSGIGASGFATQPNLVYQVNQTGLGQSSTATFTDCDFGINTSYVSLYTTQNKMTGMGTGINSQNGLVSIATYNTIECSLDGIYFNQHTTNNFLNASKIQHNIIDAGDVLGSQLANSGITVNEAAGAGSLTRYSIINNDVNLLQGKVGIAANNTYATNLADNDVIIDNAMNTTWPIAVGIRVNNGTDCIIGRDNTVTGDNTIDAGLETRAFAISGSNNSYVGCNTSDNCTRLHYFNGASTSLFTGNEMQNANHGLFLTNSAVIGAQNFTGNEWTGTYSVRGATSNNLSAPLSSPFKVTGSGSTLPTFTPLQWFLTVGGSDLGCFSNIMDMDSLFDSTLYINPLDYFIANDSDLTEDYTEAVKWTATRFLYHKLKDRPDLWATDSILTAFMDKNDTTNIYTFWHIEKQFSELLQQTYYQDSSIQSNDSLALLLYDDMWYNDSLLIEGGLDEEDSLNLIEDNVIILGEIYDIDSINALLAVERVELLDAYLSSIVAENDAIITSFDYEDNEVQFNLLLLTSLIEQRQEFTNGEIDIMEAIAVQCPISGGPAVYKMRGLYSFVSPIDEYDDDDACGISPRKGFSKEETSDQIPYVFIAPNPNKGEFTLQYLLPSDGKGELVIFDVYGKQVFTKEFEGNSNNCQVQIAINYLSSGIYFCNVNTSESSVNNTFKLVINK